MAQAALPTIQRSIARWENEDNPVCPGERYQLLLAHIYAERDSRIVLGPGSDFDRLRDALMAMGVRPDRLRDIAELITERAPVDGALLALLSPGLRTDLGRALADPGGLDQRLISRISEVIEQVNAQVGAVPFVRLQLELLPVVEVCRSLLAGRSPTLLRAPLLTTAVSAYTLAARLAFETHDDSTSQSLYAESIKTAGGLPDTRHRAAVRTSHAMVTLYATGDLGVARRLATRAVEDARKGSSAVLRARAHALYAEMSARDGDERKAFTALHDASHALQRDNEGDPAGASFGLGRLCGFEGVCRLHSGSPEEAEVQLSDSVRSLGHPRDAVQRAIVLADLALARIRQQAPDSAAELLHDCVDLTAGTRGRVPAQRIRQARLELSPWRAEPFVVDLDEHIHSSVAS